MREIKFRGKRIDNGQWIYGSYFRITIYKDYPANTMVDRVAHFIIPFGIDMSKDRTLGEIQVEVGPNTVDQYSCRNDKNGKEIYGRDIVICRKGEFFDDDDNTTGWDCEWKTKVTPENSTLTIFVDDSDDYDYTALEFAYDSEDFDEIEVIGNFIDNPELLEVQ